MNDNVNHPAHCTSGGIEYIDAIRASMGAEEFQGYAKGAVLKYVWRWRQKGGVEDLRKAGVYLDWLIESAEGGEVAEAKDGPDYIPWHEAPHWATGAVRDRDGLLVWLKKKPDCDWGEEVLNSWRPRPVREAEEAKPEPATIYPWHEAPNGANYAAMDSDGVSHWYSGQPYCFLSSIWSGGSSGFQWRITPRTDGRPHFPGDWKDSLEARP